ncbi:MAG: hypothetical protein JWO94_2954 [Verrucomicrobiaceae bacterium]|nr:hypothetical protein [Verrucomicrobiaceae bacterium]
MQPEITGERLVSVGAGDAVGTGDGARTVGGPHVAVPKSTQAVRCGGDTPIRIEAQRLAHAADGIDRAAAQFIVSIGQDDIGQRDGLGGKLARTQGAGRDGIVGVARYAAAIRHRDLARKIWIVSEGDRGRGDGGVCACDGSQGIVQIVGAGFELAFLIGGRT